MGHMLTVDFIQSSALNWALDTAQSARLRPED
jgi:hypothetical protein